MPDMGIELSKIEHVITHENCADGLACAILIREANKLLGTDREITIEYCQYGIDRHRNAVPRPNTLFADFSPHRETIDAWKEVDPVIFDHHVHAKDIVEQFPRGVFDNDRCGARILYDELAEVWSVKRANYLEQFIRNVDIRDRWLIDEVSNDEWRNAMAQHNLLMSVHHSIATTLGVEELLKFLPYGAALAASEFATARDRIYNGGDCYELNGLTVMMVPAEGRYSSAIGELARNSGLAHIACTFFFVPGEIVFSMRSGPTFDCGAFAKFMGGGGHARAAAFALKGFDHTTQTIPNPVPYFMDQLERYVKECDIAPPSNNGES